MGERNDAEDDAHVVGAVGEMAMNDWSKGVPISLVAP